MPVGLGPLETIVNVSFPGGFYVTVEAIGIYQAESPAHNVRRGHLVLTEAGLHAGGELIKEENYDGLTDIHGHPYSRFIGLMSFKGIPDPANPASHFVLQLSGQETFTDTINPSTVEEFCGTSTSSGSIHYHLNTGRNNTMEATETLTHSTPAGTSSITFSYDAADVPISEDGTTVTLPTTSSDSIWYVDQFGNYVDTKRPCSELPPPGTPVTSTHTDAFNDIHYVLMDKQASFPIPLADWSPTMTIYDPAGGFLQAEIDIPQYVNGETEDHVPIHRDLPAGDYEFRIVRALFENFPRVNPTVVGKQVFAYPILAPVSLIVYNYQVASYHPPGATDYILHFTDPALVKQPLGLPPSTTQVFSN